MLADDERFELRRAREDQPYLLEATLKLPLKGSLFQNFPVVVQYFTDVQWDELKEGERLVLQSKEAFARGRVDIGGQKTLVGYAFKQGKKISVKLGWLGWTADDGEIRTNRFSPNARTPKKGDGRFSSGQR